MDFAASSQRKALLNRVETFITILAIRQHGLPFLFPEANYRSY